MRRFPWFFVVVLTLTIPMGPAQASNVNELKVAPKKGAA